MDPLPLYEMEPDVISKLEPHIEAVLSSIATQAPNAVILVLGYPRLFAGDLNAGPCAPGAAVGLIAPGTKFLNEMGDRPP